MPLTLRVVHLTAAILAATLSSTAAAAGGVTPGLALARDCAKVHQPGSEPEDRMARGSCLRFIEGAVLTEAFMAADARRQSAEMGLGAERDPTAILVPVARFCVAEPGKVPAPHQIAQVAVGLAKHLQGLPASELDRKHPGDPVQSRLLVGYLQLKHPCGGQKGP